jgi:hypothetical protein
MICCAQVRKVSEAEAAGLCMPEIDREKLTKEKFITSGGEGEVWTGTYAGHEEPVAIKIVKLAGQVGKRDRTQVRAVCIYISPSSR